MNTITITDLLKNPKSVQKKLAKDKILAVLSRSKIIFYLVYELPETEKNLVSGEEIIPKKRSKFEASILQLLDKESIYSNSWLDRS